MFNVLLFFIVVGDRLKKEAEIKLNEEHNEALKKKVEELLQEKNKTLDDKIRPEERLKYEKSLCTVMEQFDNCKIAVNHNISII